MAINKFADYTEEERAKLTGLISSPDLPVEDTGDECVNFEDEISCEAD